MKGDREISETTFKEKVIAEATNLKKYLRPTQKKRLVWAEFNPFKLNGCVYGLVYGDANYQRAINAKKRFAVQGPVTYICDDCDRIVTGTALEVYLMMFELGRRPVFDYIKSNDPDFILQL